jgi:hypothetical protein
MSTVYKELFDSIENKKISISAAGKKYNVSSSTIRYWVAKEYVKVLYSGTLGNRYDPKLISEGNVAFMVDVRKVRRENGITNNIPTFDVSGNPILDWDQFRKTKINNRS